MTSQINANLIDATYPIAGQDNDTQGFRDNFSNIKIGLSTAGSEITDLQTRAVVVADENNDPASNNLLGSTISNGVYAQFNGIVKVLNNTNGLTNISLNDGPLQVVSVIGNTNIVFADWPESGQFASVRVHIKGDGLDTYNITLATDAGDVVYEESFPSLNLSATTDTKVFEAWTFSGGSEVFVRFLGNYVT